MRDASTLVCYTLGHSDRPLEDIVAQLERKNIDLVADVRAYPYIPYLPQFDRTRLDTALHSRGISYIWLGMSLGCLTADGRIDPIAREKEPSYQEGITALMDILPGRRVCLLSSESDWRVSHRHNLIAQTLMRYGIIVRHIELDGSDTEAPADLFHLEEVHS